MPSARKSTSRTAIVRRRRRRVLHPRSVATPVVASRRMHRRAARRRVKAQRPLQIIVRERLLAVWRGVRVRISPLQLALSAVVILLAVTSVASSVTAAGPKRVTPQTCTGWQYADAAKKIDINAGGAAAEFSNDVAAVFIAQPTTEQGVGQLTASTRLECSSFGRPSVGRKQQLRDVELVMSLAYAGPAHGTDALRIATTVDGTTWTDRTPVSLAGESDNAQRSGYLRFPLPAVEGAQFEKLQIRIDVQRDNEFAPLRVAVDGIEVQYATERVPDVDRRPFFGFQEHPTIVVDGDSLAGLELLDADGHPVDAPLHQTAGDGETTVRVGQDRILRPGTYILRTRQKGLFRDRIEEYPFSFGLITLNTSRTHYQPGELVPLAVGVVDDQGKTVCDARLTLDITKPDGAVTILSTADGSLQRSDDCGPTSITSQPDYSAQFIAETAGEYRAVVSVTTSSGRKTAERVFTVGTTTVPTIERLGPTRINPKARYVMRLLVTPTQNFSGTVEEQLPRDTSVSQLSPKGTITTENNEQQVRWNVEWQAGKKYELRYTFDAPNISPALLELGPLRFGDVSENRRWSVAVDETVRREDPTVEFTASVVSNQQLAANQPDLVTVPRVAQSHQQVDVTVYKEGFVLPDANVPGPLDENRPITVKRVDVTGPAGKDLSASRVTEEFRQGARTLEVLHLVPDRQFKPGVYTVAVTFTDGKKDTITLERFAWGVLALNMAKSVYEPNEKAVFGFGAVNSGGHTVCDAALTFTIRPPTGEPTVLRTADRTIAHSPECGPTTVTNTPDYSASYTVDEPGEYALTLTGVAEGVSYTVTDTLHVQRDVPIEIERRAPTRIYPLAEYAVTLEVRTERDYQGTLDELLPATYGVVSVGQGGVASTLDSNTKRIQWTVDLKAGVLYQFNYRIDPEDISPALFLLGPATLGEFTELRQWQIASDAVSYTGKQLKTVEYALGGGAGTSARQTGTDNNGTAIASGTNNWFGSSWHTTEGTAGTKTVTLDGTNIRVVSATLKFSATMVTVASVTEIEIGLDVNPGPSQTVDVYLDNLPNGTNYLENSGTAGPQITANADATALFQGQSDGEWASGLAVHGVVSVTSATTHLHTMKLVLTYESDYSTTNHEETKTIRLPVGAGGANNGTQTTNCAVSSTCSFTYDTTNRLQDLDANGDIYDVWFEISASGDTDTTNGAALSYSPSINGGAAGTAHSTLDPGTDVVDHMTTFVIYRPSVATNNFDPLVTASDTVDIVIPAAPAVALSWLTVELVITYVYDTGDATQTETVRYFYGQDTTNRAVDVKTAFAGPGGSTNITISNGGLDVRNMWFKVYASAVATGNLQVYGDSDSGGGTAETSSTFDITSAQPRSGSGYVLLNLTSMEADFASGDSVTAAYEWNTAAGSVAAAELYVTFTWSGSSGGTQTKTNQFYAGGSGATASTLANGGVNATPFVVTLPETVTKTYRSAYLQTNVMHSQATSLTTNTYTVSLNQSSTTAIPMLADTTSESYDQTFLKEIGSSQLAGGATIGWTTKRWEATIYQNDDDTLLVSTDFIITYDAAFGNADPQGSTVTKQLKTVEYALGGGAGTSARQTGTDNNGTAIASGTNNWFGSSWHTTEGTAGTKTVTLDGTNIRVVSATLKFSATMVTSADITDIEVGLDVNPGPSQTVDVYLDPVGLGNPLTDTSGTSGPQISTNSDATALFQGQTDGEWASGLAVHGVVSVTGPTTHLHTMKLVLTYESDYSTANHEETKTVRFPLDSTDGSDTGTRQATCPVSTTCSFTYDTTNRLQDLDANGDIYDVWFEISASGDTESATNGSGIIFSPSINGGAAGTTHSTLDPGTDLADHLAPFVIYRPSVAANNFDPLVTASDTIDIVNPASPAVPMSWLTVELVITYVYDTGDATQTETVRYFYGQDTTNRAVDVKTAFAGPGGSTNITISNGGLDVRDMWVKVYASAVATGSLQVYGDSDSGGGTAETSQDFAITSAQPRSGSGYVLLNLTGMEADFASGDSVTAAYEWNTAAGSVAAAELYVTFTWSGSSGGTQTKTNQFYAGGIGAQNSTLANGGVNATPFLVTLPETVTKTYRSAYLVTNKMHSQATSLTTNTTTISLNQVSTTAIPMLADTTSEAYEQTFLKEIGSSQLAGGATIGWRERYYESTIYHNDDDENAVATDFVITYDAAYETITLTQNHYRWRDDTTALNTDGGWTATQDNIPTLTKSTTYRIRLEVANTGAPAQAYPFRLEFAARTGGTCGDETFAAVPVTPTSEHFEMVASGQFADQDAITASRLSATGSFTNGRAAEDPSNNTNAITIGTDQYTEVEFAVQATSNASDGGNYCFRVTNLGSTTNLTYSVYGEALIATSGITIDGTCDAFDQTTDCTDVGTIKVAVNGSVQAQEDTTIAGTWQITSVAATTGQVITIWIDAAASMADRSGAVFKYDGTGNVSGVRLFKEHLTIGSDDDQTITNADVGQYDNSVASGDDDVFWEVSAGNDLTVDTEGQSSQEELYIDDGDTFRPASGGGADVTTFSVEVADTATSGVGTWTADSNAITVAGHWAVTGSGVFSGGTSTVTMTGTAHSIIGGGQTFSSLTIDPASAGTITVNTSDFTVGATLNVADSDALSISSGRTVTLSGNTGTTLNLNTSGTVSGAGRLTYQNSATTLPTAGTISSMLRFDLVNGNMTMPNRTFGGTVEAYNGTGNARILTPAGGTYTLSGSVIGIADGAANITVDWASANPTVNLTGDLDVTGTGGGTEIITTGTGTWTVSGNVDLTGATFTATAGNTFQMNGSSKTLTSAGQSFRNFAVTGGSVSTTDTADINGTFQVTAGSFTQGANVNMNVSGNFTLSNSTTFVGPTGSGKLILDGDLTLTDSNASKQNLGRLQIGTSPDTTDLASDMAAKELVVAAGDVFNTNGYDIDIGDLGITVDGTFNATDDVETDETQITTEGSVTINSGATYTADQSTLTFDGASGTVDLVTDGSFSLYNLTLNDGGGSLTVEVEDALDVNNNLTITGGTLDAKSGEDNQINVGNNWSNADIFTARAGTVVFDATDTGNTINGGSSSFSGVTFNGSNGAWSALTNTLTATGDLTMIAGTLNTASGTANVTVNGNVQCNTTCGTIDMSTAGTNTFTQSVSANKSFGTNVAVATNWTFYNLTFTGTSGTRTITVNGTGTGSISVRNDLQTTNSGTSLNVDNNTNDRILDVDNDVTIGSGTTLTASSSASFTVGGSWDNNGTFAGSGGTVIFDSVGSSETIDAGSSAFSNVTINNGLVSYHKLDEAAGVNAFDSSGYGNTGTYTGSPTLTTAPTNTSYYGNNPGAITLNGSSQFVDLGTPSQLNSFTDKITMAAWVNPNIGAGLGVIIGKSHAATHSSPFYKYALVRLSNNSLSIRIDSSTRDSPASTLTAGWQHVAGVYTGSAILTYRNGTDVTSGGGAKTGNIQTSSQATRIGGRDTPSSGNAEYFNGGIDDARIYNRALSSAELTSLYNGNHDSVTATYTLASALDVDGDLQVRTGKIDVSASNCSSAPCSLTVGGSLINVGGFDPRTGTVTLDATGSETLQHDYPLYDLTTAGSGGTWTLGGQRLDVNHNLTLSNGTLDVSAASCYSATPCAVTVGGGWDNDAAFEAQTGTVTFDAGSGTHAFDGDGTGTEAFYDLILNDSGGSTTWQMTAAADVDNDFTLSGGTFDFNGSNQLTIGGNLTNRDTIVESTGTVLMNGTSSTHTIDQSDAASAAATELYNLELDDGGGTSVFTSTYPLDVNNNLTITGGALDLQEQQTYYLSSSTTDAVTNNHRLQLTQPSGMNFATSCEDADTDVSDEYCVLRPGQATSTWSGTLPTTLQQTGYMLGDNIGINGTYETGTWTLDVDSSLDELGRTYTGYDLCARIWKATTALGSASAVTGWECTDATGGAITINFTGIAEQTLSNQVLSVELAVNFIGPASGSGDTTAFYLGVNSGTQTLVTPRFSPDLDIGGNYTNNDTFTAGNGIVTLDGAATQTMSGTMTGGSAFHQLTITNASGSHTGCGSPMTTPSVDFAAAATVIHTYAITTPNVRVEYNAGSTYTFEDVNWNGGNSGTRIIFRSSASSAWNLDINGTQTDVSYVSVAYSDATATSGGVIASNGTNEDCNNNTNWTFASSITITGSAFTDDNEGTPLTSTDICVAVNSTLSNCDATDGSGVFLITGVPAGSGGEQLTLFIDGGSVFGNTVTIGDGANIVSGDALRVYQNHVIARHDNGGSLTIALMDAYDNDQNATDLLFDAEDSGTDTLVVEDGHEFFIPTGHTFAPGGNLDNGSGSGIDSIDIRGTYTAAGSQSILVSGNWLNSGTFTPSTSTVTFDATDTGNTINNGSSSFSGVSFNGAAGAWSALTNTMTVTGDLLMIAGTLNTASGTANVTVNGNVQCSGTCGTIAMSGTNTFTHSVSANKSFGTNVAVGTTWTFYNLTFTGTSGARTITFNGTGTGTTAVLNNFTTTNSGTSLSVDLNTNDRVLDVDNDLTIGSGTTLTASNSASFTVGGSWDNNGTFTANGGTVTLDSVGATETIEDGGSAFGNLTINNGLVAYHKLDEGTGTDAYDSSGYGNTGTYTGSPTLTAAPSNTSHYGSNPNAVTLNGTSQFVDLGNPTQLNSFGDKITMVAWVKPDTAAGLGVIMGKSHAATHSSPFYKYALIRLSNNVLSMRIDSNTRDCSGCALTNTWQHVAGVYNGSAMLLYINGSDVSSGGGAKTGTIQTSSQNVRIGGRDTPSSGNAEYFKGDVDDARIYNRALSSTELTELYNGTHASTATYTLLSSLDVDGDLQVRTGGLKVDPANDSIVINMTTVVADHTWIQDDSGVWHLFFQDAVAGDHQIEHHTTTDFVNFTDEGYALSPGGGGTFDSYGVWAPHVVKSGSTYYMFYAGVTGAGANPSADQSIGLATSSDLETWTKVTDPAVCSGGAGNGCIYQCTGTWTSYGDNGAYDEHCRDPFVTYDSTNSRWVMFSTAKKSDDTSGVIDVAYNSDITDYDGWAPAGYINETARDASTGVLGQITGTQAENPFVMSHGGTYYLWFNDWEDSEDSDATINGRTQQQYVTSSTLEADSSGSSNWSYQGYTPNAGVNATEIIAQDGNTLIMSQSIANANSAWYSSGSNLRNLLFTRVVWNDDGTFDSSPCSLSPCQLYVGGNYINVANLTPQHGLLTLDSSDAASVEADMPLGDLTVNGAGTHTLNRQRLDVNGTVRIQDGTLDVSTSSCSSGTSCGIQVGSNWDNTSTFTARTGTVTFDSTTTNRTIKGGSSSFSGITFNGSGGSWQAYSNALTVTGTMTLTAGTLTGPTGSANITVNGSVTCGATCGSISMSTGTFTQAVAAAQSFGPSVGLTTWQFNNLTQTSTTGSPTITYSGTGTGTISIVGTYTTSTSGTALTVDNNTNDRDLWINHVSFGANTTFSASSSGAMDLVGNWTNNGTFTHNSGTVTLSGEDPQTLNATMTGSSAFNDLTITNTSGSDPVSDPSVIFAASATTAGTFAAVTPDTKLRFNAGSTYTLQNIHFNGQATGTRVFLRSSAIGTDWNLNVAGTRTVSNTDVRDSDACGQAPDIDATDGTNFDSTGNFCWLVNTFSFSISDTTVGFGSLSATGPRYATGDQAGSGSDTVAHTMTVSTNARAGYAITFLGNTLTSGANTIDVASISNDADGTPGTEQFGASVATNGNATIASGYAYAGSPDWTWVHNSTTTLISETGGTATEIFSLHYLANISAVTTHPGLYSNSITYVATPTF